MNTARKMLKTCKYEDVDIAPLKWFKSKVNEDAMITGPIFVSPAFIASSSHFVTLPASVVITLCILDSISKMASQI